MANSQEETGKKKYINLSGLQAFYDELPEKLTVNSAKSAGSADVANNAQNLGGTAASNVLNSAKSGAAASAWITANQTDFTNLKNIKAFKTIAGINATISADSLSIENGGNISITTANKTITLSAKDTTYTSLNEINTNEYDALTGVSGVTGYFTNGSAKSADKATSATSASILTNKNIKVSSADYAVSAGAAPVAPHDHEYLVKVNGTDGTALSIKNDIGLKASGNNIKYYVSGQDIYISAKDTTYNSSDFITASSATNISNAYTWASDWNSNKTNVVNSANSGAAASAWITAHKDDYLAKSYSSNSAATFAGTANSANYATKAESATSAAILTDKAIKVNSATSADYATKAGSASKAETLTNTAIKVASATSSDYATNAGSASSAANLTNKNIKVSSATSADYASLAGSASSAAKLTDTNIKVSSATSADYATNAGSATNAENLTNTAIKVNSATSADYATNAGTATRLKTSRNIAASGDITWSVSFNGNASVTGDAAINNVPWSSISSLTSTVNSSTTNKLTTPKAVYDFVTASIVTKAAFIGPETSLDNFTTPYDKAAIYLVGPIGTGTDRYNEYVVTGTAGTTADFLLIGDTSTDLSDYLKSADFNTWSAARFDGNSAKWSKSATSASSAANLTNKNIKVSSATSADYATDAGTASYATSAGAAPFINHDHNYKISAGSTAFNVSSNIQLSAGTNIGLVSAGTNVIGITAKDTTPNNKTITITSGASPATGSFTLNQNSDKTITLGTMAFKASGDFALTSHNHNYKLSGAGTALDVSAGINLKPNGNIAISTAANTINISAKDTTYTSLNGVNSTEYNALTGVSGVKSIKNYAAISAASGTTSKGSFAPANSADTFTLIAGNNIDFVSGANSLTISSKSYTIPTVNNKTITITTAATPSTSQSFTLNQSSDKTISFGTMAFKASGDYSTTGHNHNMTALNGTANFFSGTTAAPSALSALTAKYAVSAGAAPVASHTIASHSDVSDYFSSKSALSALTSKSALSAGSAAKAASATSALTAGIARTVIMSEWASNSARPIIFSHPSANADSLGYDSVLTFNPYTHNLITPNFSAEYAKIDKLNAISDKEYTSYTNGGAKVSGDTRWMWICRLKGIKNDTYNHVSIHLNNSFWNTQQANSYILNFMYGRNGGQGDTVSVHCNKIILLQKNSDIEFRFVRNPSDTITDNTIDVYVKVSNSGNSYGHWAAKVLNHYSNVISNLIEWKWSMNQTLPEGAEVISLGGWVNLAASAGALTNTAIQVASATSASSSYNGRWSKADDNLDLDRPLGMAFSDASASWTAGSEFYRNTVYDKEVTFNSKTNVLKTPILSATTISGNLSGNATSAKNAGTASYATSAGAAPLVAHDHSYTISAKTTAFNVSAGIQLSAGSNISITSAGTKSIGISARNDIANASDKSTYFDGTSALYAKSATSATNAAKAAALSNTAYKVASATSATNADKLTNARNIAASGDVTWSVSFNGTTGVTGNAAINSVPWFAISSHTAAVDSSTTNKFTTPKAVNDAITASMSTKASFKGPYTARSAIPTADLDKLSIYLVGPSGSGVDKYEEWILTGTTTAQMLQIGDTSTDLSNYAQKNGSYTALSAGYATATNTAIKVKSAESANSSLSAATATKVQMVSKGDNNWYQSLFASTGTSSIWYDSDSKVQYNPSSNTFSSTNLYGTTVSGATVSGTTVYGNTISAGKLTGTQFILVSASATEANITAADASGVNAINNPKIGFWNSAAGQKGYIIWTDYNNSNTWGNADSAFFGGAVPSDGFVLTSDQLNTIVVAKNISATNLKAPKISATNLTGVTTSGTTVKGVTVSATSAIATSAKVNTGNILTAYGDSAKFTNISATNITGLIDKATSATKAVQDGDGNTITTTYGKKVNDVYYVTAGYNATTYPNYDTTKTYATGSYIVTGSRVYSASAAVTVAGSWASNSSKFTTASTTVVWSGNTTATSEVTALTAGLKISLKVPSNMSGAATTQLNLNSLGAKTIRKNNGNLTTHLPFGTIVYLTYDGTYWVWADYDSNSNDRVGQYSATDSQNYPIILKRTTGGQETQTVKYSSAFTYNPSTSSLNVSNISSNNITATTFSGNLSGTATKANDSDKLGGVLPGGYSLSGHNHAYKLSGNGTAVNVSAGVNFKPSGSNVKFYVSGNDIYISAKNDNSTAYIPSGFQVSGINGTTTGVYYLSALKLNAGTNIGFTSASNSQITITAKDTNKIADMSDVGTYFTGTTAKLATSASGAGSATKAVNDNYGNAINASSYLTKSWSGATASLFSGKASSAVSASTAAKATWVAKSDNQEYKMAFSLNSEFNYNSNYTYNPSLQRLTIPSAAKIGGCTLQWNASTSALDFNF